MLLVIVRGKRDSGKSSAIIKITRSKIEKNSSKIDNLLTTTAGTKLNQNYGVSDIFEIINKNNLNVGVLSAGDVLDDFIGCLNEFNKYSLDVLILAERKYARPTLDDEVKKLIEKYKTHCFIDIEKQKLDSSSAIENEICNSLIKSGYQSLI
mgnify:CR=1 FL=1